MAAEYNHHLQPEDYDICDQDVEDYNEEPYEYDTDNWDSESDSPSCRSDPAACTLELRTSSSTYNPSADFMQAPHEKLPVGLVIDKRYKITGLLGKGSFAAAYSAQCLDRGGEEVVIKARVSTSGNGFSESLDNEFKVYQQLGAYERQIGIPCLYSAGVHKLCPALEFPGCRPVYVSYLAIQRLGPSLWSCCHTKWGADQRTWQPAKTDVIEIGKGMLKALASIHSKGYIHKDVKTDNFCIEGDDLDSIYAIDYGFSRPAYGWYDYKVYGTAHASFWGTPNYASMSSLLRQPQTPRDDLEALVYNILELECDGCFLPWNLTTNSEAAAGWTDEQLQRMERDKCDMWSACVAEGVVPAYLREFFEYIQHLKPCHLPDYSYLVRLLDCGLTGQELPSMPASKVFSAWPKRGELVRPHEHNTITDSILQELRAAASVILTNAAPSYAATETAAMNTAVGAESDQVQQQYGRKRHSGSADMSLMSDSMSAGEDSVEAAEYEAVTVSGATAAYDLYDDEEVDSAAICIPKQNKRQRVTAGALEAALEDCSQPEE